MEDYAQSDCFDLPSDSSFHEIPSTLKCLSMKVYNSHEIKNIALLGNDGSGKTTLTEALLFECGQITISH